MIEELRHRKINFLTEMNIPLNYRDKILDIGFRCDLFVENCIVAELKAVNCFHTSHEAQLLSYMKLLKCPKGILLNFNCQNIFKEGQVTFVNEIFRNLPNGL